MSITFVTAAGKNLEKRTGLVLQRTQRRPLRIRIGECTISSSTKQKEKRLGT